MTTESTMPVAPAASLLFQAPVFQAAPEVATPIVGEGSEPQRRRASTAPEEESAPREETSKRRRRSKKTEEAPVAAEENVSAGEGEETPVEPKTRRRRRPKTSDEASAASEENAEKTNVASRETDSVDEEDSSSRRRRRRRARSAASSSSEENSDPVDQVQALKGSTRLEAKKMRRREGRREGRRRHSISESEFLARRESVERTMVIRDQDGLDQIAILEDGLLVEHYVARRTQSSMVGNIYLGRVQNVLPSMEAAFVDVGRGRNAVLYAGEVNWDAVGMEGKPRRIESALKSGDPVLVQVTKDPIGHKGARLTSQITLAGRYLVLIPGGSMMGISRKLPDKERARLKKILKAVVPSGSGVIVRTAAEGATLRRNVLPRRALQHCSAVSQSLLCASCATSSTRTSPSSLSRGATPTRPSRSTWMNSAPNSPIASSSGWALRMCSMRIASMSSSPRAWIVRSGCPRVVPSSSTAPRR